MSITGQLVNPLYVPLNLRCESCGANPPVTVEWLDGSNNVLEVVQATEGYVCTTLTYSIARLERSHDNLEITCRASSSIDPPSVQTVAVNMEGNWIHIYFYS